LQLKPGVHAPTAPVDNLLSNWADRGLAGLAWSLKAWAALLVRESPQPAREHRAEEQDLLRMEFRTSCAALIEMPCQSVRDGRRLIYRLLPRNPWNGMFLRLVERLHPPSGDISHASAGWLRPHRLVRGSLFSGPGRLRLDHRTLGMDAAARIHGLLADRADRPG
jgi:hypothetical protein